MSNNTANTSSTSEAISKATSTGRKAYRGEVLHFLADPAKVSEEESYQYFEDGLLVINHGLVEAVGNAKDLLKTLPADVVVTQYDNGLIMPGFIDTHVHYAQSEICLLYTSDAADE